MELAHHIAQRADIQFGDAWQGPQNLAGADDFFHQHGAIRRGKIRDLDHVGCDEPRVDAEWRAGRGEASDFS